MPVDAHHCDYDRYLPQWQRIDDVIEGEDAVKDAGETYLPKVSTKQKPAKYEVYKTNAYFLEATGGTVDGLLGLIFRRLPVTEAPPALDSFRENATLSGIPWDDFCQQAEEGVIEKGRYGVLVEYSQELQRPFVRGYEAEEIINWRCEVVGGASVPVLIVLRESEECVSEDGFCVESVCVYRVLRLVEGRYTQSVWRERDTGAKTSDGRPRREWQEEEPSEPSIRGEGWDVIPFVFFGPKDLTPEVEKSPILPLVNANLCHYRRSAEWAHGLRMVALPTPYVTGYVAPDGAEPQELGPDVALEYPDPTSKVGMLESSGTGLQLVRTDLLDLQGHMAHLGAQLLEQDKREAEAAETLRLRQAGKGATLTTIARTGSRGLTRVLAFAARFLRQDPTRVSCALNTDFFDAEMPTDKLTAIVASWQQGAITRKTLVWNLKKGEILEDGAEVDSYLSELEKEEEARKAAMPSELLTEEITPGPSDGEGQETEEE